MLDPAETDIGMQVGLWIIHVLLEYSFVYLFYRWYMVMKRTIDEKIKSPCLNFVGFLLVILIPTTGCMAGLKWLLPGFDYYWSLILLSSNLVFLACVIMIGLFIMCRNCFKLVYKFTKNEGTQNNAGLYTQKHGSSTTTSGND